RVFGRQYSSDVDDHSGLLSCPTRRSSDLRAVVAVGNAVNDQRLVDYRLLHRLRLWCGQFRVLLFCSLPLFTATNTVRCLTFVYLDRKSTRLNSSHVKTSYAVFCLKKKPCK